MRSKHSLLFALLVMSLALMLPCVASAQAQNAPEGVTWGDYQVQQSIEFGYRFSNDWQKGNFRTFDSYINLHEGPRLLENTLSMRSISHDAPLFDNLFISTFGFGGDPNNVARVKISKNKWYNFSSAFRRDQNFFDYPLLGNPLNPAAGYFIPAYGSNSLVAAGLASATATSIATPQPVDSAHPFATRRRMSDFDLTLLPQAVLSVRMGYSRNRITGPAYTSFHEGSDFILGGGGDNFNTTNNTYRIGADFKGLPKTTISYDQTFDYYKNDSNYDLAQGFRFDTVPLTAAQVKSGLGAFPAQTIDFGLPFFGNPVNNPCANFFVNTAGQVNPNCSGLWLKNPITGLPGYYKYQRTRSNTPSEQLSFVSRAIKNVDLNGRYIYSSSDMTSPFYEDFYGAVTRTQERRWGQVGNASARAINNSAEISGTIHLSDKLRVQETFRYLAWRTPTSFTTSEWASFPALMASGATVLPGAGGTNGFTPFLLLPIMGCLGNSATPANCNPAAETQFGAHNSSSGADLGFVTTGSFLGQTAKWNTVSVEYDFFKSLGARIGYRYGTKRDAEKGEYEEATEYFYPNPTGVGSGSLVGLGAAQRGACTASSPRLANGVCKVETSSELSEPFLFDTTEHTALLGLWVRPSHSLRFNGEVELSQFDAAVTRVSPRRQEHYRFRSTWQPTPKATLSATYNGIESTNPGSVIPALPATIGALTMVPYQQPTGRDIDYKFHNRNLGFTASIVPSKKVAFDVAYNYNDYAQTNQVCAIYTSRTLASALVGSSVVPGLPICPLFPDQVGNGARTTTVTIGGTSATVSPYNLVNGKFASTNHFVSFYLTLRPAQKLTTQIGYSLSTNSGDMLTLSPWQGVGAPSSNAAFFDASSGNRPYSILPNTFGEPGSLASNYHMPTVIVSYEFVKNWTAKAQWNYWGYGEGTVATGTGVSNGFRANAGLVSLRYAF